ncbi:tail fiber domain-containing protein [Chitinophagaceae bacterium LB-8]|uniref:Tail fiber domain-containing protein n=1 Tax=Paraflavisolibacter caeni TaxID=2982496 RepID=A0A9X3B975_9BACT|nr:tail fiber domain-containing protein [Paraflavisolibacter caeni]MCU7551750.1 tail fiber domain-containing protein [Paraflavisolibacter caeni]
MKKHLFLLLGTACIGIIEPSAQNWVNGGNSLAANGSLGTNTNFSLIFKTNNTERGRITNGGNWAIGSTGTTSKFTVNSAASTSPFRAQINGSTKLIVGTNGGVSIGTATAGPANGLYVVGSVGIGTATPSYKLHVEGGTGTAIFGNSSNYTPSIYGYNTYSGGTAVEGICPNIGVYGYAGNYGVYGVATSAGGYGVYGVNNSGSTSNGRGVYGSSSWIGVDGIGNTFGVRGNVSGASAYAVGAISSQSIGLYAYTGNSSSYAGYFAGRVYSSGGYTSSDRNLKEDIVDVSNAMDVINQLKPKSYKFRQDGNYKLMNLPQGKHFGLIAQDVEQILPDLVADAEFDPGRIPQQAKEGTSTTGTPQPPVQESKGEIINFKALNYTELIPIMVKAMQEQQQVITEQQNRIEKLEQLVYKLSNGLNIGTNVNNAKLGDVSPNPVKGTALISYSIPEGSKTAQLLISDALGRQIKVVQLSASGVINVDVSALAKGVYNYSLIVDNSIRDTKKMTVIR